MDQRKLKQKEQVEAEIKREKNAEVAGDVPENIPEIKEKKIRTIPEFLIYFQIYDIATKNKIVLFENYDDCKAKSSAVRNEFKGHLELTLLTKFERETLTQLNSTQEGYGWVFFVNKKNWIYFLFYDKKTKLFEVKEFFNELNSFVARLEEEAGMSEEEIKKNLKQILAKYFEQTANNDNTSKKINRAKEKLEQATGKIEKALEGVNVNLVNMEVAETVAKQAYAEAKEMNDQAEELANLMADRNKGMTIILVVVAVLLAVAVFGNLYATINAPPPQPYPYPPPPPPQRLRLVDRANGDWGSGVEDKDLIELYRNSYRFGKEEGVKRPVGRSLVIKSVRNHKMMVI